MLGKSVLFSLALLPTSDRSRHSKGLGLEAQVDRTHLSYTPARYRRLNACLPLLRHI